MVSTSTFVASVASVCRAYVKGLAAGFTRKELMNRSLLMSLKGFELRTFGLVCERSTAAQATGSLYLHVEHHVN